MANEISVRSAMICVYRMFWKAASAGSATRLHVNAQLIDTRTDTHVWAEQYDRDLNDLFAIQSEIAQKVADQLHAKISPAEKLAIERKAHRRSRRFRALFARQ